ncbi:hypothetical protein [Streptomyces gobiensis]|uniref:hypothetical protein n=1 Tax=Streptomyces gobiensis TaxID=2875706 RepID=UPI001E580367|nr:hypothetical protein [Streptomyces gobiensis]UGY93193.1 hypothetical protein test1122_16715 [Streptomyces gobiensis]
MTRTSTIQEKDPTTPAVLYICARRRAWDSGIPEAKAREEGQAFAEKHRLRLVREVTDFFGESVPRRRPGWREVVELATEGLAEVVIVRWPHAISPDHEYRYKAITELRESGGTVA